MHHATGALLYTGFAGAGFTLLVPPLGITLMVMAAGTAAFLRIMDNASRPRFA